MSNDATRRAEFIAYFNKHFHGERQKFMEASGLSKGRITQYFDEDEPFGEKAAAKLEERLHLTRGQMFPSLATSARETGPSNAPQEGVPVVGTAQLGDDGHYYELEYPVGHGDGRVGFPSRDRNAYAVRCKGESMAPRIRHGEFAVVEPNHPVSPGDEVLVRSSDGRVMIKVFAYSRDGMVHLDSINNNHQTFPRISLLEEDVAAMHYVAGTAKSAMWFEVSEEAAPSSRKKTGPNLAARLASMQQLEGLTPADQRERTQGEKAKGR
ncbi:S24 family peptidase [Variovorax ginsengisoli]|uniref:S24 family peptidase n=1 Tax=Variovorax ginsengisoli TaxID=363844 RepID=A0ABT8RZ25_9BURK|nr:S24 family peptidase [Variovorax ginsengisoli]MDN8612758.1 S24 family peptidase [Variovorax ginsengisoli]MDO1531928.1 S24 family peptidase [Variovorax ginsengisoli]